LQKKPQTSNKTRPRRKFRGGTDGERPSKKYIFSLKRGIMLLELYRNGGKSYFTALLDLRKFTGCKCSIRGLFKNI